MPTGWNTSGFRGEVAPSFHLSVQIQLTCGLIDTPRVETASDKRINIDIRIKRRLLEKNTTGQNATSKINEKRDRDTGPLLTISDVIAAIFITIWTTEWAKK